MKTTKIANSIKNADSIIAIIAILNKIITMMDCDVQSIIKCSDEFFALACIKAIRMGEFDKLMFEFPSRCKIFLATHGFEWEELDNYYDECRWNSIQKRYM